MLPDLVGHGDQVMRDADLGEYREVFSLKHLASGIERIVKHHKPGLWGNGGL